MLIRKNTKAFKTIRDIIVASRENPGRMNLVRLYITKAGHSIEDRISIEGIQGDVKSFYELSYNAVLSNLTSSERQLQESDTIPGIYFFQSNSNKLWDETPFEFDDAVRTEFSSLVTFPTFRKKGKVEKFSFVVGDKEASPGKKRLEAVKAVKPVKPVKREPSQPSFKLTHYIHFTELDKIIFSGSHTKREVLNYYDKISGYILPYLKDRPIAIKRQDSTAEISTLKDLMAVVEVPDWVQRHTRTERDILLCNDKDHLLWYVENDYIEFRAAPSRVKTPEYADYVMMLIFDPIEHEDLLRVTLATREIVVGLKLPAFVKTDGGAGLHIYLPLDASTSFKTATGIGRYIRKLTRLKVGDLISQDEAENNGKVIFKVSDPETKPVAPYSLLAEDRPAVAAPIHWSELKEGFQPETFDSDAVSRRVSGKDEPFRSFYSKKVNGKKLLKLLDENYSFLV